MITIFGAARSGVAAANFLAARGERVRITDAEPEERLPLAARLDPRVERFFGGHPDALLDDSDTIILSPGVPASIPILRRARERGIPIVSEIELAFRSLRGRVVAITGSNGKSTTTALIGKIFEIAGRRPVVAGNIGDPLIASIDEEARDYVVELSSFQLETVESFRASVALLLNITPDHLDRYESMDAYAEAKYRIFRNQTSADFAVVNADDPRTATPPTGATVWRFSSSRRVVPGAWFDGTDLVADVGEGESRIARSRLALTGNANLENALAAWLAARASGVDDRAVAEGFESFAGLPHRMVLVRELDGVRWINDSKGTNVDATVKSLEGMEDGRTILVVGGKDKKGEFERLRPLVEAKCRVVITIGEAAGRIAGALEGCATIADCGDMERAVAYAQQHAREGDVVLLSPACASFDQYGNFEERGRHFEHLVRALPSRDRTTDNGQPTTDNGQRTTGHR